jgi:hypothetical protein
MGFIGCAELVNSVPRPLGRLGNVFLLIPRLLAAGYFISKIKDFRRAYRGVKDIKFLLFRLTNIFA